MTDRLHVVICSMSGKNGELVYSTDKLIVRKEGADNKGVGSVPHPHQEKVVVRLERKGRGGKSVTVVEGLQIPEKQQGILLKRLKSGLGTGGTLRDAALEILGDHREALMTILEEMGYQPKRSGG